MAQGKHQRLREAFSRAHGMLDLDVRKRIDIKVTTDPNNYYSTIETPGTLTVELSNLFLDAPDDVQECLALVILSKSYKVPYLPSMWDDVKEYLAQDHVVEKGRRILLQTSSQVMSTGRGDHHDLTEIMKGIKEAYFEGQGFKEPTAVWSRRRTHAKFGYWMEDYDVVVINRILDHPDVPAYVVAYVLYHELLHKKHGSLNLSGARECHYHHFNIDEKRFEQRQEAEAFLDKVYKSRGQCLK
jgi:hypothetical protein